MNTKRSSYSKAGSYSKDRPATRERHTHTHVANVVRMHTGGDAESGTGIQSMGR